MNIQSAEKQITKLLEYVKTIYNENPNMYNKSKQRLANIAQTCNEVVSLISEILESEILFKSETHEFSDSLDSTVTGSILSMESSLSQLKQFLMYHGIDSTASSTNDENLESIVVKNHNSQTVNIVDRYISILSKDTDALDTSIRDLIDLLLLWLNARFKCYSHCFNYTNLELANWIRDIVIIYAYYIETSNTSSLLQTFHTWCDSLKPECTYGVPYIVYSLKRERAYTKYLTFSSLIIWDALLDFGLDELCTILIDDGYLSEDSIYQLCEFYKPELIANYEQRDQ